MDLSVKGILSKVENAFCRISSLSLKGKMIIMLVLGIIMYCFILKLNLIFPYCNDDYIYMNIWNSNEPVMSISDVIRSQVMHYNEWGGRFVAHFIVQSLLILPSYIVDILNSLMFMFYIILIYLHSIGNKKEHSISLFCLIFFFIWFYQISFGEDILWTTGSGNYLWCTSIVLLFLLPYRINYGKSSLNNNFWNALGLLVLGLIAGCTNENVGISVILVLVIYFIYFKINKYKVKYWMITGFIGFIVGYIILMLAPGNYLRYENEVHEPLTLVRLLHNFIEFTSHLYRYIGSLIITSFFLLIIILSRKTLNKGKKFLVFVYTLLIFVSFYALLPLGNISPRACFFTITCAFITFGIIYMELDKSIPINRFLSILLIILFSTLFFISVPSAYSLIKGFNEEWVSRAYLIKKANRNNENYININYIYGNYKWSGKFIQPDYCGPGSFMYDRFPVKFQKKDIIDSYALN